MLAEVYEPSLKLTHAGSKEGAEELFLPLAPKWAWCQWKLGFAVHPTF